jgi:hypothetical protein
MAREEDFDTQSNKYVEMRKSFGVNDPYMITEINEAFDAGYDEGYQYALQHPHWIPVEERKPQERGHYLVYSRYGDVWLSEWMQDKEGRWDWYVAPICVGIISKVTHWMPLPKAPRKEE